MHAPPKVQWPVPAVHIGAGLLALLWTAGLLAHGAWWMLSPAGSTSHLAGLLLLVASGLLAWRAGLRPPVGLLESNDQGWCWLETRSQAVQGDLEVCVDFQRVLLLRFQHLDRRVTWLWVASAGDAGAWRAFRRALFAPRARVPAPPAGRALAPLDPLAR